MFSLSMFGPFWCSVFRWSVPFEVRSFDIQSFDVRFHSMSVFRCSVPFKVRSFDVQPFSTFGLLRFGLSRFSLSRFGLSRFGHSRFGHSRFGHGFQYNMNRTGKKADEYAASGHLLTWSYQTENFCPMTVISSPLTQASSITGQPEVSNTMLAAQS